ncbi:MAG TPA: oxygenase MpaB family protein, partial [Trebonia sp.]
MTAEAFPGTGLFERAAAGFAACVPADPADDGFFGPASVTWRLHADLSAPVSGLRSLLLQALHPLAMAGVDQHSQWRDDPGARFASTSAYVLTTTYGDRAAARGAAARVRKIHEWVRGTDPVTGQPYAAGDPALLIWVHAAQVESNLAGAASYGAELTAAEQDQYVAEMTAAAELVGIPPGQAPASVGQLEAYFE